MQDKLDQIVQALKDKACTKQSIYRQTMDIFNQMKTIAETIAEVLSAQFDDIDKNVIIEYKEINEFEFHLKFSGDLLIFTMHSNVTTFPQDHVILKSPYVQEQKARGYFGSIMVYNFMADSLKYNRQNDPGYLLARRFVNQEGHFYIEGVRQLSFLYPDIAKNKMNAEILKTFIESAMVIAIAHDLYAANYKDIAVIPLGQKLMNQMVSGGAKVGFQMS
ncbi:MAG: hypothetical protein AAF570_12145 [Bacteroidota bacterium]